jgi:hypothetical protein
VGVVAERLSLLLLKGTLLGTSVPGSESSPDSYGRVLCEWTYEEKEANNAICQISNEARNKRSKTRKESKRRKEAGEERM